MLPEFVQEDVNINPSEGVENVELKIIEYLIHIICVTVRKCSRMKRRMREFFSKRTLLKLLPCSTRRKN